MLLAHSDAVSESASHKNGSHEKNSCEKLSESTKKHIQNDLERQNTKRTAFGFNSLSTSGTSDDLFKIDRNLARMRRMKHGVLTSARLHEEELQSRKARYRRAMLTLTYADIDGWAANHISELTRHIRQWCKRRRIEFRYVWVAELQKRGAVHYHMIIWLPRGVTLPKPDKQGWWRHGHTRIEWVRRPIAYLASYTTKDKLDTGHLFPKGCRVHDQGGLSNDSKNERCWWLMPKWVKEVATIDDKPRRAKGGGIVLKSSGEILESPWKVLITQLGIFITRRY